MTHATEDRNHRATTGVCPANGRRYRQVPLRTVLHHVRQPWQRALAAGDYFFCTDPDCDVVYFGADASLIRRTELRTAIGQKSTDPDRTVCYCFGVSAAEALGPSGETRAYVLERTKHGDCACAIRNPSGRCCLGDFPDC